MSLLCRLTVPLLTLPLLVATACTGTTTCTDAGCENEAVVTFPPSLVSGAYDLLLDGDMGSATIRCLDPGAPETQENPAGITCDAQGFTLLGHSLANARSLRVTIIPVDEDPVIENEEVRLEAVDERNPNGPDCPPTCFVRNGQVRGATT